MAKRPPRFQTQPCLGILFILSLRKLLSLTRLMLDGRFFSRSGTTFLIFYLWAALSKSLTPAQICDLPPGTISDIVNEHNLTVHWTEKHTHRDCALYTGETNRQLFNFPCTDFFFFFPPDASSFTLSTSSHRSMRELVPRLRDGSGALQVPSDRWEHLIEGIF